MRLRHQIPAFVIALLLTVALLSGCTPRTPAPTDSTVQSTAPAVPPDPTTISATLDWLPHILAELGYPGEVSISQSAGSVWICENNSAESDGKITIEIQPGEEDTERFAFFTVSTEKDLSEAALNQLRDLANALAQRFYENAKPDMVSEMFVRKYESGNSYYNPGQSYAPPSLPNGSHYLFESYCSADSEFRVEYGIRDAAQYGTALTLITHKDGSRELQIHSPTPPEPFESTYYEEIQQSVTDALVQAGHPLALYIMKNGYDMDCILHYTGEGTDDYSPYITISLSVSEQDSISSLRINTEEGAAESAKEAARLIFSAIAPYCSSTFTPEYLDAFYELREHIVVSGIYDQCNRYGAVSDGEYTTHEIDGCNIGMQVHGDRSFYYIDSANMTGISTYSMSEFLKQLTATYDVRMHIVDGNYYHLKASDTAAIFTPAFSESIEQLLGYPLEDNLLYRTEYQLLIISDDEKRPPVEVTVTTRVQDQSIETVSTTICPVSSELLTKDLNWFHQVAADIIAYCSPDTGNLFKESTFNTAAKSSNDFSIWDYGNVYVHYFFNHYDYIRDEFVRQIDLEFTLAPLPTSENLFTTLGIFNGTSSADGNFFNLPGLSDITSLLNAYYANAGVPVTLQHRETEGRHTDYDMYYEDFGILPTSHFTLRVNHSDGRPYNFLATYVDELSDSFDLEEGYYYYGMTPGVIQQLPIALSLLADPSMTLQEAQQLFSHALTPDITYPLNDSGTEVTITSYCKGDVAHILCQYSSSGGCVYEVMTKAYFDEHYGDLYTFAQSYFG